MRIKSLLLFLCVIIFFKARSQVYFRISSGYGLPLTKQVIFTDFITGSSGDYAYGGPEGSLGKGFRSGFFSGYIFKDHWNGEVGFEDLKSSQINSSVVDSVVPSEKKSVDRRISASLLNINPSVGYNVGEGKFTICIRTGLLIGVNGKITSNEKMSSEFSPFNSLDIYENTEIFKGGISWGFSGGIGLNYSLNKLISFSAQAIFHAQTWSPDKSFFTKYIYNGIDKLTSLPVSEKEFEYHRNVSTDLSYHSSDSPTIRSRQYFPFSSYGLTLGVSFILDFSKADSNNLPE